MYSCMNEEKICIRAGATIVRRDVEPARDFVTGFDLAQDLPKMVQIVTKRSEGGPTRWWHLPPTPKEFTCSDSEHEPRPRVYEYQPDSNDFQQLAVRCMVAWLFKQAA